MYTLIVSTEPIIDGWALQRGHKYVSCAVRTELVCIVWRNSAFKRINNLHSNILKFHTHILYTILCVVWHSNSYEKCLNLNRYASTHSHFFIMQSYKSTAQGYCARYNSTSWFSGVSYIFLMKVAWAKSGVHIYIYIPVCDKFCPAKYIINWELHLHSRNSSTSLMEDILLKGELVLIVGICHCVIYATQSSLQYT
jgi:hypothetical protein